MNDGLKEVKSILADIIDEIRLMRHDNEQAVISIAALRGALKEIDRDGRFEEVYSRHYRQVEAGLAEIGKQSAAPVAERLAHAIAERLRQG